MMKMDWNCGMLWSVPGYSEEQDLTMHSVELPGEEWAPELPEDATLRRRSSMFDGFRDPESGAGFEFSAGLKQDSFSLSIVCLFTDDSDFRIEVLEIPLDAEQSTFTIAGGLARLSGTQFDLAFPHSGRRAPSVR